MISSLQLHLTFILAASLMQLLLLKLKQSRLKSRHLNLKKAEVVKKKILTVTVYMTMQTNVRTHRKTILQMLPDVLLTTTETAFMIFRINV